MQLLAENLHLVYNKSMAKYCFILGRTPLLSLAEIFNRQVTVSTDLKTIDLTSQALIVKTDQEIDAVSWQKALGGCVKIGKIFNSYKSQSELIQSLTTPSLKDEIGRKSEGKIVFGFSLYGDLVRHERKKFNSLGLHLKKEWQRSGLKSRFIVAKDDALSSVQVIKNKLLTQGAEILVVCGLSDIYLGLTVAVQDFEDYSGRDYGRPRRDSRSGMLPPKLAKIMLNLGGAKPGLTILDPFCGSGTILQEALLMNIDTVIGSDISQKAVADTIANLNWLQKNRQISKNPTRVFTADVSSLDTLLEKQSVDLVVTEPFLGPTISKNISIINMLSLVQELETLYLAAFKTLARIIKPGGRLVFVFPLFKTVHGIFALKILERLEKMGFSRINPFPENISLFAKIGPTARGSLIYSRPDQKVEREIFVFQYKSR